MLLAAAMWAALPDPNATISAVGRFAFGLKPRARAEMGDPMAIAGFCEACNDYVYLTEQWGCVNGHAWNQIRNWYDPDTGAAVTPYWLQPGYTPAPAEPVVASPAPEPVATAQPAPVAATTPMTEREGLLAAILETLGQYPGYDAKYGTDTDILIDNKVADASWGVGKKKIEYSAMLKAVEAEKTVYFWEMLKEVGSGMNFGGFESESYTTIGKKRSGKTKQVILGPGGVEVDAEWDYGATRKLIEGIAAARGWRVKVVLRKGSAKW